MTSDLNALGDPLRDRAVKQLKKRRDFMSHLLVYVLVNSFIVLIWAITNSVDSSGRSFPWLVGASVWS